MKGKDRLKGALDFIRKNTQIIKLVSFLTETIIIICMSLCIENSN